MVVHSISDPPYNPLLPAVADGQRSLGFFGSGRRSSRLVQRITQSTSDQQLFIFAKELPWPSRASLAESRPATRRPLDLTTETGIAHTHRPAVRRLDPSALLAGAPTRVSRSSHATFDFAGL
jgi:hypothetical protein